MKAIGLLKHHFWGEYSATLYLKFDCPEDCEEAVPFLNSKLGAPSPVRDACGNIKIPVGWVSHPDDRVRAAVHAAGDQLDRVVDTLVDLGADRDKVVSLARSVDRGEQFDIQIPYSCLPNTNQMKLLL